MELTSAADALRRVLVPFLAAGSAIVALLLVTLVVQRGARSVSQEKRRRLQKRYRPLVDSVLGKVTHGAAISALRRAPARHAPIIGDLLLAPLRSMSGRPVEGARELARSVGLADRWRTELTHRHWWLRAGAARALGLIADPSAYEGLVAALDDAHDEVRAAAVEGLGRLGDARAVSELVARLPSQSRHQRVRIIEALREIGRAAGPQILEYARQHVESLPLVGNVLALTSGPVAVADVTNWCGHDRADVRAAALGALGTIGLDDRTYYHALKALGDPDPTVRAMAARAVGRSGRGDAARYLARHLDDDWAVAGQSARALRDLGPDGLRRLEISAASGGPAAGLARQMLWEASVRGVHQSGSKTLPALPRLLAR